MDDKEEARRLHDTLSLVGLRAHATAVGLVQLCSELLRAGVLDDEAMTRIKDAIAKDIIVARTASRGKDEFETSLRRRLDRIFPKKETAGSHDSGLGSPETAHSELGLSDREPEAHPS